MGRCGLTDQAPHLYFVNWTDFYLQSTSVNPPNKACFPVTYAGNRFLASPDSQPSFPSSSLHFYASHDPPDDLIAIRPLVRVPHTLHTSYCNLVCKHLQPSKRSSAPLLGTRSMQRDRANKMTSNIYAPFPLQKDEEEIRLLEVQPEANRDAPIVCRLFKATLKERIYYNALSYVWGKKENCPIIQVNGVGIEVTPNLHDALKRIRDKKGKRVFWIDAICINQVDQTEKGYQVGMMGKIYFFAHKVQCWLGPAENRDDQVLSELDTTDLGVVGHPAITMAEARTELQRWSRVSLNDAVIRALCSVGKSPYWTRSWVYQEFGLAQEISCIYGDFEINWGIFSHLAKAAEFLRSVEKPGEPTSEEWYTKLFESGWENILGAAVSREGVAIGWPIKVGMLAFLKGHSHLDATDPRDKLFAFWGILQYQDKEETIFQEPVEVLEPLIGYQKPVEQLYTDFARAHIEYSKSLAIVGFAGVDTKSSAIPLTPSWVPDWSFRDSSGIIYEKDRPYKACGDVQMSLSNLFQGMTICPEGVICDKISMFSSDEPLQSLEGILLLGGGTTYPTGIPRLQAFLRTLVLDQYYLYGNRLDKEHMHNGLPREPYFWLHRHGVAFLTHIGGRLSPGSLEGLINERKEKLLAWIEKLQVDETSTVDESVEINFYVKLFRIWCQAVKTVVDDMLSRSKIPACDKDGCLAAKPLNDWVIALQSSLEDDLKNRDSLEEWSKLLDKVLLEDTAFPILEPFLGPPGTIPDVEWPEFMPLEFEDLFYPSFLKSVERVRKSCMFSTGKGYVGLGPKGVRKGDEICVLFGNDVPFVLRRVGQHHVVVGQCFVLGLMDGEAIEWKEQGKVSVTSFKIE